MGHVRLGSLHLTKRWQEVVSLVEHGAAVSQVANAAIRAAKAGMAKASRDCGVVETVHLLLRLPHAAKGDGGLRSALSGIGIEAPASPGLMDLVGGFTAAVDARMPNNCGRTDLGEMAQMAAAEAIAGFLSGRMKRFWDAKPEDLRDELGKLHTLKTFGALARAFFARLTHKVLDYFLSRDLYRNVGEGKRFVTLARVADFNRALGEHCHEAAAVVERFGGDWLSATVFREGEIDRDNARDFAHGAMAKLAQMLERGAGLHAA